VQGKLFVLTNQPTNQQQQQQQQQQQLTHSLSVTAVPEGSSPYSQKPATGLYPKPTGSTLHSPNQSP
jgi:hypothetical protein